MALRNDDVGAWLTDHDDQLAAVTARLSQLEADNANLRADYPSLQADHQALTREFIKATRKLTKSIWAEATARMMGDTNNLSHKHKLEDVSADLRGLHMQRATAKLIALGFTKTDDPDDIGGLSDRLILRVYEAGTQG
jgi:hypothetical protein